MRCLPSHVGEDGLAEMPAEECVWGAAWIEKEKIVERASTYVVHIGSEVNKLETILYLLSLANIKYEIVIKSLRQG